ncbi:uncharacterized protein B0T23DRAFT_317373, partial [Neurospora hispaniola]
EEVIVPVYYKPLPKGRNFIFNLENRSVVNTIVNSKLLKLVLFKNSTHRVRIIPKKQYISYIKKYKDDKYFVNN